MNVRFCTNGPITCALIALSCIGVPHLTENRALGVVTNSISIHTFEVTPLVKQQVHFWNLIFSKFPSTSVVIHDQNDPQLLIDLIDFKKFSQKYGGKALYSRKYRDTITDKYIERYELAIRRFKTEKRNALRYGAIEKRLYEVYGRKAQALARLYKGDVTIRGQGGLADEFITASQRAYQYLPYMEQIFKDEGLPVDLTRLAFVESMFNIYAVSKAGASGIWQFMPATAKQFMRVDSYFDERNSPLKATKGAAQLLKQNFKKLKSWPLAVTAYNHGAGGMQRAIRITGSKHLDTIIRNYDAKSFGFASKNFYAEFIAARNVFNNHFKRSSDKTFRPQITSIKLKSPISLHELVSKTPLSRDLITEHNPCLLPRAYSRYRHSPLPANYELFVPVHLESGVRTSLSQIHPPRYRRS